LKFVNFFKKRENNDILLHFHIFKNAGSTIEWVLIKNFSKMTLSIDEGNPGNKIYLNRIVEILRKNKNVKAISSHQFRFPITNNTEFNFLTVLFIRHPIDRAFSIYYFKKKEVDNSIGSIKARSLNLQEFMNWNLSVKKYIVMKNFQVFFLSDKIATDNINEKDLELAIQRMKSCVVVGIVDQIDQSLVVAEEELKKYFPEIDLSYIIQNTTKREKSLEQRLKEDKMRIDEITYNELINKNKLDFILYEETKKELEKRINHIENFEQKLLEFKNRCEKLKS